MTLLLLVFLLVCPPAGDAKDAKHAALNRAKNRVGVPAQYTTVYYDGAWMRKVTFTSTGPNVFADGIALEGWVVKVKHSGPESCNCHSATARDWHIYLGPRAGAALSECVICEITPRWQAKVKVPVAGSHVRIRGWAFWDAQHQKGAAAWRATAWEIHPVTGITVL